MLDPVLILQDLAESCSRAEDCGFWILVSAVFHLEGGHDNKESSAEILFWRHTSEVA